MTQPTKCPRCPRCAGENVELNSSPGKSLFAVSCLTAECRLITPIFETEAEALAWWAKGWTGGEIVLRLTKEEFYSIHSAVDHSGSDSDAHMSVWGKICDINFGLNEQHRQVLNKGDST